MSRIALGALAVLLVATALACGGSLQVAVHGQDRAAGADGTIDVERQDTGNYVVNIQVSNLLPPARFGDGLTTYAVWFQAPDQQPQRVGVLAYDEDDRAGQMMATTSLTNFEVIITGEAAADAVSPSEHIVFRATIAAP